MAKKLAAKWLEAHATPEYRATIYYMGKDGKNVPNVLRSFRDARLKIGTVEPIPDLGVAEHFDGVEVWSADRDKLVLLCAWFDQHGYESSGVW